jgi:hypothetical protein
VLFRFGGLRRGDAGGSAHDPGAQVEQVPEQSDDFRSDQVRGGGVTFVRREGDDDDYDFRVDGPPELVDCLRELAARYQRAISLTPG